MVSRATMATSAAASAPASAAALPPPGTGAPPASSSSQPSRVGPAALGVFGAGRGAWAWASFREAAPAPSTARSGTRPTTSLFRTATPRCRAAASTAANTVAGDVTSMSSRFIDTCAFPSTSNPEACTAGSPPLDVRIRFAMSLARSEEHTSELQSQSNLVCRLLLEKKYHWSPQQFQQFDQSYSLQVLQSYAPLLH